MARISAALKTGLSFIEPVRDFQPAQLIQQASRQPEQKSRRHDSR
jgi:hypothetical protein